MMQIIRTYIKALGLAFSFWKLWLLIFLVNLLAVQLVVWPLRIWMGATLGRSRSSVALSESFDLNIIMDLIHSEGSVFFYMLPLLLCVIIIYAIWISLASGGLIHAFQQRSGSIRHFFSGGLQYLLPNIRISFYIVFLHVILLFLAYSYFAKDGLNVLEMEDELFLIRRFWFLLFLLIIASFFISIWRDLSRIFVALYDRKNYWYTLEFYKAFRSVFSTRYLLMALLNYLILACLAFIYFSVLSSKTLAESSFFLLALSQMIISLRIILKVARLGSFYILASDKFTAALPDHS